MQEHIHTHRHTHKHMHMHMLTYTRTHTHKHRYSAEFPEGPDGGRMCATTALSEALEGGTSADGAWRVNLLSWLRGGDPGDSYLWFVTEGFVSLVGRDTRVPVRVLLIIHSGVHFAIFGSH